jgi:hypothetical protein
VVRAILQVKATLQVKVMALLAKVMALLARVMAAQVMVTAPKPVTALLGKAMGQEKEMEMAPLGKAMGQGKEIAQVRVMACRVAVALRVRFHLQTLLQLSLTSCTSQHALPPAGCTSQYQ